MSDSNPNPPANEFEMQQRIMDVRLQALARRLNQVAVEDARIAAINTRRQQALIDWLIGGRVVRVQRRRPNPNLAHPYRRWVVTAAAAASGDGRPSS